MRPGEDEVTVGLQDTMPVGNDDLAAQLRRLTEIVIDGQARNEARFDRIDVEITGIKMDITGLKTDVAGLKSDMAGVKADVAGLKTDVAGLKTDVAGLKTDMA